MPHILITGNPVDGLNHSGPYDTNDDAIAAGEIAGSDWWVVELAAPPVLALILITTGEDAEDGPYHQIKCPYCSVVGTEIVEMDTAVRRNTADLQVEDDQFALAYGTGDSDFEHVGYVCFSCDRPVTLPEGYENPDEDWS